MVKIYYFISACLLLFACNNNNNNNNNKEGNVNDTINDTIVERLNNPLAGKKFYYLDKEENGELTLSIFPYLEDDYDMAKIIFTDSMLIDGWNVMEPSEWKIERVSQQDSLLIYHLQMMYYPETQETFKFNYNEKKGILYRKLSRENRDTTFILIDSLKSNSVRKVKAEWIPWFISQLCSKKNRIYISIFTGSYTEDQLSKIELSAIYHNKRVECQRVNTIDDVINIINSGDISNKKDKSIRKVKSIFIYSHGYVYEKNNEHEGVIAFDYDNKINEQKLDKSSFSKIDNNIFLDNNRTELYSYACRTGIGVSSTTGITDPKKNNSLAQHMANIGKITVFAYMRKTDYKNTWGTIAHRRTYESDHDSGENIWENFKSDLYDMLPDPDDMKEFSKYRAHQEIIDGAVWNINGAYIDVKPGTTPDSVPDTFYKYTPKKWKI